MPGHDYPLEDTPYLQGRRVRANGFPVNANPYFNKEDEAKAREWWQGWQSRDAELRRDEEVRR